MVQMLDERIYWTDESLKTSTPAPIESKRLSIFPNPVKSHGSFQLSSDKDLSEHQIAIFDSTGKIVYTSENTIQNQNIAAPSIPGIYLLVARKQQERIISRLVVVPD
jgi:hypothetical protein